MKCDAQSNILHPYKTKRNRTFGTVVATVHVCPACHMKKLVVTKKTRILRSRLLVIGEVMNEVAVNYGRKMASLRRRWP